MDTALCGLLKSRILRFLYTLLPDWRNPILRNLLFYKKISYLSLARLQNSSLSGQTTTIFTFSQVHRHQPDGKDKTIEITSP